MQNSGKNKLVRDEWQFFSYPLISIHTLRSRALSHETSYVNHIVNLEGIDEISEHTEILFRVNLVAVHPFEFSSLRTWYFYSKTEKLTFLFRRSGEFFGDRSFEDTIEVKNLTDMWFRCAFEIQLSLNVNAFHRLPTLCGGIVRVNE